jgi:hypothetical protein
MATIFSLQSYVQDERNLVCRFSFVYFKDVLFIIVMPHIKTIMFGAF